jgi:tRNA-specific 2-thiouridylase
MVMSTYEENLQILNDYGIELTEDQFVINQSKKVICGMSGGVDSSACAAVLKLQGYHVIGMFMKNWEEQDEDGVCTSEKEYADVVSVCEKLDIPYYSVNFVEEYKSNVFDSFISEFEKGHTPNPDVLCNREIKFKVFFEKAMSLGAQYLATGHYCQTKLIDNEYRLVKGADNNKDQSYFLYTIKSSVLKNVLFPIGNIKKIIVRKIARDYDLITHDKKDSTGICFIGERNFKKFLSQYIKTNKGNFVTLDGRVMGQHDGLPFYTMGQRKGLGLGGPGGPWFVVGKNFDNHDVIVAEGESHPSLYADELTASDISWVDDKQHLIFPKKCRAKVRYRQQDQDCTLFKSPDGLKIIFDKPQRAITKRQSVVLYDDDICLGGAIINSIGDTYYQMNKELPKT